eukprot:TRINITY_DN1942_c0_g1_i6.p1 TRINITY_DN1942_c0_g1~~TRINITY_DN1942_c0_g1_i6.p1  ORF type:complete len:177 (-),score=82.81 TRINITY_DN1942_c0_g1_i6:336-821(-)
MLRSLVGSEMCIRDSEKAAGEESLSDLQSNLAAQHLANRRRWEEEMALLRAKLQEQGAQYEQQLAALHAAVQTKSKSDQDALDAKRREDEAAHLSAIDAMKSRWQQQIRDLQECHEKELAALKTVISAMPNASKHIRDAEALISSLKGTHRATSHVFERME